MSLLWAVPAVAVAIGAVMALVLLRGMAEAVADLRVELQRFSEVRVAITDVRTAAAEARTSLQGLRRA